MTKKAGLMGSAFLLSATIGAGSTAYAQEDNTAAVYAGYKIYKQFNGTGCSGCHGALGAGGGAFPDLAERVKSMSKDDFIAVVRNGKEGTIMPKAVDDAKFKKFSEKYGLTEDQALDGTYTYIQGVVEKTIPEKPPQPAK